MLLAAAIQTHARRCCSCKVNQPDLSRSKDVNHLAGFSKAKPLHPARAMHSPAKCRREPPCKGCTLKPDSRQLHPSEMRLEMRLSYILSNHRSASRQVGPSRQHRAGSGPRLMRRVHAPQGRQRIPRITGSRTPRSSERTTGHTYRRCAVQVLPKADAFWRCWPSAPSLVRVWWSIYLPSRASRHR